MLYRFFSLTAFFVLMIAAQCKSSSSVSNLSDIDAFIKTQSFDQALVEGALREMSQSPHPIGSDRQAALKDYFQGQLKSLGLEPVIQEFTATVPNPILLDNPGAPAPLGLEKQGYNILASLDSSAPCTLLIGSHYDSKYFSNFSYVGANDSGSSSAALLWVLKALQDWKKQSSKDCTFTGVWFDGEEAYLTDWDDGLLRHPIKTQDNTYGSRNLVDSLESCGAGWCLPGTEVMVTGLLLLDMIGSPDIYLTKDINSTATWLRSAMELDEQLELKLYQANSFSTRVSDDHIPFLEKGLPAINLIDFHNLDVWHKPGDELEKVSIDSIERASKLAVALAILIEQEKI